MENYNKLLEKAKEVYKNCTTDAEKRRLESIFPELRDEDTVMKEVLYNFIAANDSTPSSKEIFSVYDKTKEDCLAWLEEKVIPLKNIILNVWELSNYWKELTKGVCTTEHGRQIDYIIEHWKEGTPYIKSFEKQDEQKSTNTKTKFHEGDWVVHNGVGTYKIVEVCESWYEVISYNNEIGIQYSIGFDKENDCRLWTIQDAKDGDVLVSKHGVIFINNDSRKGKVTLNSYCYLSVQGEFCIEDYKTGSWLYKDGIKPATKEQRDLFFVKMKKAGYKWDAENKVIRKQGDQKSTNKVEPKFKVGDWIICDGLHPALILNIADNKYEIEFTDNGAKGFHPIDLIDRHNHLWTIQDAKDGDVVVDKSNGTIGIFQRIGHHPDGGSYNDPSYCFLHCRYSNGFFYANFENGNTIDSDDLIPATKEQRAKLEKAITEAGYRWNKEKLKLEKI